MNDCNRDDQLVDFQACTGIEDVDEAINYLEASQWDLLKAIKRAVPIESQSLYTADTGNSTSAFRTVSNGTTKAVYDVPSLLDNEVQEVIPIKVVYLDQEFDVCLPASGTLGDLKQHLSTRTGVPVAQQLLCVQPPRADTAVTSTVHSAPSLSTTSAEDSRRLGTCLHSGQRLCLCQRDTAVGADTAGRSHLFSQPPPVPATVTDSTIESQSVPDASTNHSHIPVFIHNSETDAEYSLNLLASSTVGQMKMDVCSLTQIPVRLQKWTGLPVYAEDLTKISALGDNLTFSVSCETSASICEQKSSVDVSSDTSSLEYPDAYDPMEDVEDSIFVCNNRTNIRLPLIAPDIEDELVAVSSFSERFEQRYGASHAPFFQGILSEIADLAFNCPIEQRQLVAIYLHCDNSVLSNIFCSQLLCSESISSFLVTNFLLYGWDITHVYNENRFLERVRSLFSSRVRDVIHSSLRHTARAATASLDTPLAARHRHVRNQHTDTQHVPLFVVLMRSRATVEVVFVSDGNIGADELMSQLINAQEMSQAQIALEARDQHERVLRECMRQEQDMEYEASLMADRAKDESRRLKAEAEIERENMESMEKALHESEMLHVEAIQEAARRQLELNLPPEPPEPTSECESGTLSLRTHTSDECSAPRTDVSAPSHTHSNGSGGTCTILRFRAPDGSSFVRRFSRTDSFQDLFNYLTVKNYTCDTYKLLSGWPRKDMFFVSPSTTLESMKLFPQQTLWLERK